MANAIGIIGTSLKAWRKHKGLTLQQLEKLTGIDNGNLSKMEREVQSVTNGSLHAIAAVYDITPGELLSGPETDTLLEEFDPEEPAAAPRAQLEVGHINRDLFLAILTGFIANEDQYNRLVQHCGASNTELGATLYDRVQEIGAGLIQAGVPRL